MVCKLCCFNFCQLNAETSDVRETFGTKIPKNPVPSDVLADDLDVEGI